MKNLLLVLFTIQFGIISLAITLNVPGTYATIQAGLNAANMGDTILVQPGTYSENLIWPNTADLKLFSAGDTTNTIVDGGNSGRCLDMQVATSNMTIIRGFKFINGQSLLWSGGTGAGIKLDNGASPSIEDCMVYNCTGDGDRCYGAGVSIDGGTASFLNCAIIQNHAFSTPMNYDYGAGIYITGSANITIANSDISGNDALITTRSYGGGIYVTGSNLTLTNCSVNDNNIMGQFYSYGGGIHLSSSSVLNMTGGEIDGNMLSNTSRTYGGGLYVTGSQANLYKVKITNQDMATSSWSYGNGAYVTLGSNLYMENCLIAGNMTGGTGTWYDAGGIYANASDVELLHCTLADNNRVGGGAIDGSGIQFNGAANTLTITSSISYNPNPSSEITLVAGTMNVNYSDVRGGVAGVGNIDALPLFMGAPNYMLQGTSLCVEAADPLSPIMDDIDGNPRPSAGTTISDMGCYEEGISCSSTSSSLTEIACDSYLSPSGNYLWTSSNTYMDTIPNAAGCDSVITIALTINTVDPSATQLNAITIEANNPSGTYQWVDCNAGFAFMNGETSQTFTASANGSYAVIVTENGCIDTSACVVINQVSIEALQGNSKEIIRITDLMGRETLPVKNTPLIYIYSDGSIERVFNME